jgi:DNA repair protein RadC
MYYIDADPLDIIYGMERPKWYRSSRRKPSPYQLGMDFGQRPLDSSSDELFRFTHEVKEDIRVHSPAIAAAYLLSHVYTPFEAFDQEEVHVLLLNTKNKITHQSLVYRGTVNMASIRVAELFKPAVRLNAPSMIMAHNHPSGDVTHSPEDVAMTQMAYQAGKLLQVSLLDHLIVGRGQWLSLRTHGMGFED